MAIKKIIELVVNTKGAEKNIDKLNKQLSTNVKLETEATQTTIDMDNSYRGAGKGATMLRTGIQAVGVALKALGIGAIIAVVAKLTQALMKNQRVMDFVQDTLRTIDFFFQAIITSIIDTYDAVKENTNGFENLSKVLKSLMTLILTPLKLHFYSLKTAVLSLVLGIQEGLNWLGVVSDEAVEKTRSMVKESADATKKVITDAKDAAITLKDSAGDAFDELKTFSTTFSENVKENTKDLYELAKAMNDLETLIAVGGEKDKGRLATLRNQNEELKRIRDDESATYEERIKASDDYHKNIKEMNALNIKQAQLEYELAKKKLSVDETNEQLIVDAIRAENNLMEVRLSSQKEETRWFRRDQGLRNAQMKSMNELNDLLKGHSDERIRDADRVD